jgi:hypothetical protein
MASCTSFGGGIATDAPASSPSSLSNYATFKGAVSDRTVAVETMVAAMGPASIAPSWTLPSLLDEAASQKGDKIALRTERPCPALVKGAKPEPSLPLAEWKAWTYAEYREEVRAAARAFIALGLAPFDAVAIYGFNAPEWLMAEVGRSVGRSVGRARPRVARCGRE